MRSATDPLDAVAERARRAVERALLGGIELVDARREVMRQLVGLVAEARGLPARERASVDAELWASESGGSLDSLDGEAIGVVYQRLLDYELADGGELVRRNVARKGVGSFYTPARLSVPTVARTLEPLLRTPEGRLRPVGDLLALKLCDPAMGSGNFLVAALLVLTAAVVEAASEPERAPELRRRVAERCLHGVDLDPVAVELARAIVWLEVGDPTLEPEFLDAKLRHGDALLGGWRDTVAHFPLLALARDRALAGRRKSVLQDQVELLDGGREPAAIVDLRATFDTWTSLWFWPLDDRVEHLPLPSELGSPSAEALAIVAELRERLRFFHWELEFPDVFVGEDSGFDAILGNPPWEIQKPHSKEFFDRHDPRYRSYEKQHALRVQADLFADDPDIEAGWRAYSREFVDRGHFVRHAGAPFGDVDSAAAVSLARGKRGRALHESWRAARAREPRRCDPEHPFRHQGSADLNTYKMFIELGHALLRPGGQLGMIVPSGVYTDKGSIGLRELLLRRCRWRWLYSFENRGGIFAIHRNFKFCVIIAQKRGTTEFIETAFMRRELDDWAEARGALRYPAARVSSLCPQSLGILEIQSERDLALLGKLCERGVALGDPGSRGWGLRYATEFHTTNDSSLFVARDRAEAEGYRRDALGRWCADGREPLLPLYEGRMLGQFDPCAKAWVSGRGRGAVWREVLDGHEQLAPQFLIPRSAANSKMLAGPKIAYMRIASASNSRTMIATYLRDVPAGDSVFFFAPSRRPLATALAVVAQFNSFVYDWAVRARLGGLNLSEFLMLETPLVAALPEPALALALALVGAAPRFAPEWLASSVPRTQPWQRQWAVTRHERLRIRCMLDAIVADAYGLERDELAWILRDCDLPSELLANKRFCRQLDAKGFWRVDRSEPPQLRHGVLTLAAFDSLRELGVAAFCEQHDGAGWQLPERLRLAELGMVRSADAPEPERGELDVRSRLGPRFAAWQEALVAGESWAECERFASALRDSASINV